MSERKESKARSRDEAHRVLERIERESESVGASSLARTADKARDHFMGKDQDADDPIEVWGTRIGRSLSLIVFIGLAIYLYNTYFS